MSGTNFTAIHPIVVERLYNTAAKKNWAVKHINKTIFIDYSLSLYP